MTFSKSPDVRDKRRKTYFAFGLNISSEVPLFGLREQAEGPGDIEVRLRPFEELAGPRVHSGLRYRASAEALQFDVDRIARFEVRNGRQISVMPEGPPDFRSIGFFIRSVAIPAALHQRSLLALRGSVIVRGQCAVVIIGPAGIGKTTAALFVCAQQDWRLVADDVVVIQPMGDGRWSAPPGYGDTTVWPDALRRLRLEPSEYVPVRRGVLKRHVPIGPFPPLNSAISRIYVYRSAVVPKPVVEPLDAFSGYRALSIRCGACLPIAQMSCEAVFRQQLLTVSSTVETRLLTRPRRGSSAQATAEVLRNELPE